MSEPKMAAANDVTDSIPQTRADTSTMTDRQLAKAVLDKTVRPRVGEIRRLAEAVVAKSGKKAAKKGKSGKLAKIPGQKKTRKK